MITKLTPEQQSMLSVYRDKWLKIGLSTEPANHEKAEDAVRRAYKIAGLEEPKQIIWCGSPLSGAITVSILKNEKLMNYIRSKLYVNKNPLKIGVSIRNSVLAEVWASVRDSVLDSVLDSVWNSVWDSVWAAVRDSVRDSVRNSVRDSVRNSVRDSVRDSVLDSVLDSVWASVRDSVGASVRDSVWNSVWDSVLDSVWNSVWDSVWDSVWAAVRDSVNDVIYGQQDAHWLGFYNFFLEQLKIKSCTKLVPLMDLASHSNWWYPYKDIAILSEKPTICKMIGTRIHCDDGPSIKYPDGFSIWTLNGVRVPKWLVEKNKHDLTGKEILSLENAQQRSEGIKKVGIGALLSDLNAKTIHKFNDYKLITIEFEKREIGPYLTMLNPSTGEIHCEGVGDPNGGIDTKIKTCQQALAWRNGTETYTKPEVLT